MNMSLSQKCLLKISVTSSNPKQILFSSPKENMPHPLHHIHQIHIIILFVGLSWWGWPCEQKGGSRHLDICFQPSQGRRFHRTPWMGIGSPPSPSEASVTSAPSEITSPALEITSVFLGDFCFGLGKGTN